VDVAIRIGACRRTSISTNRCATGTSIC
jgi:hypothetical protein